ncbi:uncharacterized protein LOC124926302 [Impatiens glandulifera]|uniref:uncharacterized protein LOC124926302 n=1 Tax=Impatiens glandulifera TaxID=253017 RepID=UPI001FB152E1|nr:uncharacterized protein LOC124926302 [Impatiens glandulifera]
MEREKDVIVVEDGKGKKKMMMMTTESGANQVMDGSDIMELVGNKEVFTTFVDHKFQDLDRDRDGHLSLKELQPAVADIGAALGLPATGSSPDSDYIYSQILSEFTHGKHHQKVSKSEFKAVLSDILLGMATGLKRDPIVILRMDGEDLIEFVNNPAFETEMILMLSDIIDGSLQDYVVNALKKLTVAQGMPPVHDSWVIDNIIEPVLESCKIGNQKEFSQETFMEEFKKVVERIGQILKEQPVIVAHSETTFDGSEIKRLLSNKFELDKTLEESMKRVPKDKHLKVSTEYIGLALDIAAPTAGLPPLGAVDEMDKVIKEVLKMLSVDDGKMVKEDEMKKILTQVLGSVMLQLQVNPICVSTSSVVHEPVVSASNLLKPVSPDNN